MKLNAILLMLLLVVIFICYIQKNKINALDHKTKTQQQNLLFLSQKIKDIYNEKIILEKQKKELSIEAKKDTFDWNIDISNTNVIKRLQAYWIHLPRTHKTTYNMYRYYKNTTWHGVMP